MKRISCCLFIIILFHCVEGKSHFVAAATVQLQCRLHCDCEWCSHLERETIIGLYIPSFLFPFLLYSFSFFLSLSFHLTWMRSKSFVCEMSNHGRTHTHIRCTASLMLPYCNASPLDAYLIQIHFFSSSSLYSTISSLFVTGSNRRRKKKVLNSHANIFYKNLNCICHKNEMFQATTVIDRIRHFSLMFCAFFFIPVYKAKTHLSLIPFTYDRCTWRVTGVTKKKKK